MGYCLSGLIVARFSYIPCYSSQKPNLPRSTLGDALMLSHSCPNPPNPKHFDFCMHTLLFSHLPLTLCLSNTFWADNPPFSLVLTHLHQFLFDCCWIFSVAHATCIAHLLWWPPSYLCTAHTLPSGPSTQLSPLSTQSRHCVHSWLGSH